MDHYQTQLAHLVKLASNPGFREYAWHQAKALEGCGSGQWEGLSGDLTRSMLALKSSTAPQGTGV